MSHPLASDPYSSPGQCAAHACSPHPLAAPARPAGAGAVADAAGVAYAAPQPARGADG